MAKTTYLLRSKLAVFRVLNVLHVKSVTRYTRVCYQTEIVQKRLTRNILCATRLIYVLNRTSRRRQLVAANSARGQVDVGMDIRSRYALFRRRRVK